MIKTNRSCLIALLIGWFGLVLLHGVEDAIHPLHAHVGVGVHVLAHAEAQNPHAASPYGVIRRLVSKHETHPQQHAHHTVHRFGVQRLVVLHGNVWWTLGDFAGLCHVRRVRHRIVSLGIIGLKNRTFNNQSINQSIDQWDNKIKSCIHDSE